MTIRDETRNLTDLLRVGTRTLAVLVGFVVPVQAQSLDEALSQAYTGNPQLEAARATLRSVDETVPQALALARPTPSINASSGLTQSNTNPRGTVSLNHYPYTEKVKPTTRPHTINLTISQPIYAGGKIDASIAQSENQVQQQRAILQDTEQTILLKVATSYCDVARDQALLDLKIKYEQLQKTDMEADLDRFRVGEITQTDVSLQEAQLANATANRVAAEGTLQADRATYARLTGSMPGVLTLPKLSYPLPANLDEVITQARAINPKVMSARFAEAAALNAVDVSDAGLLPTLSLNGSMGRVLGQTFGTKSQNSASITANLTIPIDTGAVSARSRAARETANANRITTQEAMREAEEAAISSWQQLMSARAGIVSYTTAVKSNEIAAEGMRQQVQVGASTVIDQLSTEQQLLQARVQLVSAHHDEDVAIFSLLAAVGQLSARNLNLPVTYYDYEAHYQAVHDQWFGYDIDE